ncbi:hypothetical protein [Sphingomonas sp. TREG-RG-20F-R18-01]|uniref:hypothetical protein n=1 Tax=Sphingomonas sp. TREG-RG-20F-R18-01 TaxID=2914982 RepID=UPI001F5AE761|nr:hypothetical protein [Sphingomonas sp. TREG-RG-20F-R18-01]
MTKLASAAAFFAAVRADLFAGKLETSQVAGLNAILKSAGAHQCPLSWTAYALATAYHETGQSIFPNRENMNYSVEGLMSKYSRSRISAADATLYGRGPSHSANQQKIANVLYGGKFGLEQLGNTQPNDGWHFRGGGMDHCTGRKNYTAVDRALGLGGALVINPDLILDVDIAAGAMVTGMIVGRYTGKSFERCLPNGSLGSLEHFSDARCIINGTDKAATVAVYAGKFQHALSAGGWA